MPFSEDPAHPAPVENILVPTATGHHDPAEAEESSDEAATKNREEDPPA
jgi:hypothetical protein